ncbi:MAG: 50S ribosomal protein L11 methyltransferase [Flavobacteriaceae bacterium]|nr:MAG: 50S ribosomal protein L11 methyltransferase [Flavobacteriaceae bacterium]
MQNSYLEYNFTVTPLQPASDILMAELGEAGFDSFVETDKGVLAYIKKEEWSEQILDTVQILTHPNFKIDSSFVEIEQENWNEVWESNFESIQVDDQCVVRAPFHEKPNVQFDIVIEPKMSFGTGHHETTHMMLQHILEYDFTEKKVLDMGCGTGVLAILSAMKGASDVDAIDIDNWCYLNSLENVQRNHQEHIRIYEGDASLLDAKKYDVILANINKNILLDDISVYANCLNENGTLFLSGFYADDITDISAKCELFNLHFDKNFEKNNWVAVKYVF